MINANNVNDLIGATVYGSDDDKIGTVGQVYVDPDTQAPLWVTVTTGLFGTSESFVPVEDASFEGGTVRVAYEKSFVKDAPRIADDGALSEDEENALYAYYGNSAGHSANGGSADRGADTTVGYDTSGPTTDDAMTRSEERLHVGTEKVQTGRARLRKHVVTEMQTVTVPVSHEEVTLTREPITEENVGAATSGPDLSEEEHEVVLTSERVVVGKETTPVERVSLGTETVTEQQQVTEEVAHEEIELVEPDTTGSAKRD
jgi:uncharacterized protein (TIGR02271 family)